MSLLTVFLVLLGIVILLAILVVIGLPLLIRRQAPRSTYADRSPIATGDVVFLGDSLIAEGNWQLYFPNAPVRNRGMGGDTTFWLLDRLDDIIKGKPRAVFLCIGTNNLHPFMKRSDESTLAEYDDILRRFREETPETELFVQSILPREAELAERVQGLNEQIKGLADSHGCTYIDLYAKFAAEDGGLLPEYSLDELHLTPGGYERWAGFLELYVRRFASTPEGNTSLADG